MPTEEYECRTTNSRSQVAICLEQIEAEYRASQQVLHGYTPTARHLYITMKMESMGEMTEKLAAMIGDKDQAMGMVIDRMKQVEGEQNHV